MWFWIDTGWGCGGVVVNDEGIIIKTAPIFWKLKGKKLQLMNYKYVKINNLEAK